MLTRLRAAPTEAEHLQFIEWQRLCLPRYYRGDPRDRRRRGGVRPGRPWSGGCDVQRCALRAFPQRAILAARGRLALGSDWPIRPFDPREIMASACLRRPPCQPDSPPIAADQTITPREALQAYTRIPAVIGGREADEGSVAVGKFATLTVFAADPLAVRPDQLAGIPIIGTMVRSRFEHRVS
jgi:hypothetical protein